MNVKEILEHNKVIKFKIFSSFFDSYNGCPCELDKLLKLENQVNDFLETNKIIDVEIKSFYMNKEHTILTYKIKYIKE